MKKLVSILVLALSFTAGVYAQDLQSTPVVKNDKSTFTVTTAGSTFQFEVAATEAEAATIEERAKMHSAFYTYTLTENDKGNYVVVLNIKGQSDARYAQRMMIGLGFSSFEFKGKKYLIGELASVLNQVK